jgi:Rrf2 family nitric oxide-sensitive transcriptional repressor
LTHLAASEKEGTSEDLARKLDIPFNHLAKLVQNLSRRGFLSTRRGKGGGLKLAVDPRDINVSAVIEAVEGPLLINECILNREHCRFSRECKVRKCLSRVRYKIQEILSTTSILDLAPAA